MSLYSSSMENNIQQNQDCPNGRDKDAEGDSIDAASATAIETPENRAKRLRIVAQGRRATENSVLSELTATLPLDPSVVEEQDKSSVLRLALTYIRLREALDAGDQGQTEKELETQDRPESPTTLDTFLSLEHSSEIPLRTNNHNLSHASDSEHFDSDSKSSLLTARNNSSSIQNSAVGYPEESLFNLQQVLSSKFHNAHKFEQSVLPGGYVGESGKSKELSPVSETGDFSQPGRDMMSRSSLSSQPHYGYLEQTFGNNVYATSYLKSATAHENQGHEIDAYFADDVSLLPFPSFPSWGRNDAALSGSSPDSSSSETRHQSGYWQRHRSLSPTDGSAGYPRGPESSTTSPSSNEETFPLAMEPLPEEGRMMLDAVDGFLLVLDSNGLVLFVSENVTDHLGFSEADILGRDIQDFIHVQDIKELQDHMNDQQFVADSSKDLPKWMTRRIFYLGMKFSFSRSSARAKNSGYTLVQWNAKMRLRWKRCIPDNGKNGKGKKTSWRHRRKEKRKAHQRTGPEATNQHAPNLRVKTLIVLCRPVRTESILEIRPDCSMFISRHDLGFHFIFCDPRVFTLMGYEPSDMLGRTAYQFHSPWDAIICKHCAKQLIMSGTATSGYYRFLSRTGAWVWMVTQATIVYNTRRYPQYIVCNNYLVSSKLAELDLSRQKKDFDMMKYSGFNLETDVPQDYTSAIGNSISGFNTIRPHGGTVSLATLHPSLGNVDPNYMLDQLFLPEHMGDPFEPPRVKKSMASGLYAGASSAGSQADNDFHVSVGGFDLTDMEGSQSFSTDVDLFPYGSPYGDISSAVDYNYTETYSISSQHNILQGPGQGPSLPVLSPLWLRDEQNFDFTTSQCLTTAEPIQMDGSSVLNLPLPSVLANSVGSSPASHGRHICEDDVTDHEETSSNFSSTSLCEEDPSFQKDLFPILTTTNVYSLDFLSMLPEASNQEMGVDHSSIDSHQSISLTNATSFPTSEIGVNKFLHKSSQSLDLSRETDIYNKMDTPVSFDVHELHDTNGSSNEKSYNSIKNYTQSADFPSAKTKEKSKRKSPVQIKIASLLNSETLTPSNKRLLFQRDQNLDSEVLSPPDVHSSEMPDTNVTSCNARTTSAGLYSTLQHHTTYRDKSEVMSASSITDKKTFSSNHDILHDFETQKQEGDFAVYKSVSSYVRPKPRLPNSKSQISIGRSNHTSSASGTDCKLFPPHSKTVYSSPTRHDTSAKSQVSASPKHSLSNGQTAAVKVSSTLSPFLPNATARSGSSSESSSSSSDGETSGRPSLLRTLLDEEGASIQGPVAHGECIPHQTLEKSGETRNPKKHTNDKNMSLLNKRSINKRSRYQRGNVKKSTELPVPKPYHGHVARQGKEAQLRKPTTELPLPAGATFDPMISYQHSGSEKRLPSAQNELYPSNISADSYSLPDDLLDLAVEYCGSFEAEQSENLLSDFTSSFEDKLYSLVDSPAPNKTLNQQGQVKRKPKQSILLKTMSHPPSQTFPYSNGTEKQNSFALSTVDKNISSPQTPTFSSAKNVSVFKADESKQLINKGNVKINQRTSKHSENTSTYGIDADGHNSLLRAAVTTPDVDKLIEQIPLAYLSRRSSSGPETILKVNPFESDSVDPDIIVTKVAGNESAGRINRPFLSQKIISENKEHSSGNSFNERLSIRVPDKLDSIFSDHFYAPGMASPQTTAPNISYSSASVVNRDEKADAPSQKELLLSRTTCKSLYSSKVPHSAGNGNLANFASTTSSFNRDKQSFTSVSRKKLSPNTVSSSATVSTLPTIAAVGKNAGCSITKTDVSSTEPVSVMIMRKESPRSRRSKSIAVQTDNVVGEVYPEFEHSPTDFVLYPNSVATSVGSCGQEERGTSSSLSPSSIPSPPAQSPPGMSHLELFLRGYLDIGERADAATSPEDSARSSSPLSSLPLSGPSTPFLQRLLTGELSKDNYHRLDEHLREKERKQSASSGSDLDLS